MSAVRIVILMNDEPVYLGPFVRKVIAAVFNEVVGLILVPGSLIRSGKGRLSHVIAIALILGPIRFIRVSLVNALSKGWSILSPDANPYSVPIRLTHTPTTCSVAVIENSGTSDLEGIVEFECRIIHK